jgi:outer membrane protein OmpA-like peptidoglycan-associated protein
MNRPSPWLFETPTATQPEYETALKTEWEMPSSNYYLPLAKDEWEMRQPRRAMSRPAPRPGRRPSRTSNRSPRPVSRPSRVPSRSPRRPPKGQIRPRHRQPVPVGYSQTYPISSSAPVATGQGTAAPGILIATIDQFEFGSYLLQKHQFEQLHDLIIILNESKDSLANVQLAFNGHTDATGGDSKGNRSLAFRRAVEIESFVRGFLRKEHPNLVTRSRGRSSENPIAPNATKDGQAQNRRVEIFSNISLKPTQ